MKTFVYKLKLNERLYDEKAWTDVDHSAVEAHFERLKEDFLKGFILHVGRTEDPRYDGFGLVIFHAKDEEEAHAYMMKDPAIIGGQMTGKVFEYKPIFHLSKD
jgi:uncharacterized protein YciI